MKRSEAQAQLTAVAQAVRAHKAVTPDDYPVLCERTHPHRLVLWHVTGMHTACENWDAECIADWYQHQAIEHLMLDDAYCGAPMDTPHIPAYHAYAYDKRMPLAEQLEDALTTFQARSGQAPRGVAVPQAAVEEAQAAQPDLLVEGRTHMQSGHVYVW